MVPSRRPDPKRSRRSRAIVARMAMVAAAMLVTGCKVTPPMVAPPTVIEDAAWQTSLPGNVAVADDGSVEHGLSDWWRTFADSDLNTLIDDTLANNTDLQGAVVNLRIAVLERANSRANLLPVASASASAGTSSDPASAEDGTVSRFSLNLGASWELDLWGTKQAALVVADENLGAIRETLRDTQVSLIAETARTYIDLRRAQLQREVTRRNVDIQQQTYQFVDWQQQVGLSTELELAQARSRLELTRAQIPGFEDAVNRALNRLQVLTGRSPSDLRQTLLEPQPLPDAPQSVAIGIPADALRQRPDVRRSEYLLRAQAARVAQAEANRFPSLTLSGDLGESSRSFSDLFDLSSFARSLAASIGYTLFDGGRLRRNVESQKLQLERALLDYESALRTALEEAENALSALGNSQKQQQALIIAEQSASLAAELASLQYQSGLVDFQTVLDTQQALLDTQSSLAANRGDIMTNLIQLYRSLGGGWRSLPAGTPATEG